MTNAEYANNSFEKTPNWEVLQEPVLKRIERACARIERANPARIAKELKELNNNLRAEGIIGLPMQVKTGMPMFVAKTLTEEGVTESPVLEPDLMRKNKFEGTFRGFTTHAMQAETDMTLVFYDVELSEKDNLHLEAAVDASKVQVEYTDANSWEQEVHGAFAVLETVDDEDYAETVKELNKAFWSTGGSLLTRMKNLGFHSIALLSSELHREPGELNNALELILACSIDQDVLYEVKGIDMLETVDKEGKDVIHLKQMSHERIVKPIEIQYLTYFEVLKVAGETVDVQLIDAIQPVYIFLDPRTREEVAIPLRYFASIEESEHDEMTLTSASRAVEARYMSKSNGMTCGELSRDYMRREQQAKDFGGTALGNLEDFSS